MLEKDSLISPLIKRRPVCPIGAKDWVLMILMLIHVKHLCYFVTYASKLGWYNVIMKECQNIDIERCDLLIHSSSASASSRVDFATRNGFY